MSTPPTGILTSFFYYPRFDFSRIPDGVPLILDSGAFSAYTLGKHISLTEYAEWASSLTGRYLFALNLDVLGDGDKSLRNWEKLERAGVATAPVVHFGARADRVIPPYIEQGADTITLGGIAVSGAGKQVRAWAAHILSWLHEHAPHVRTHGLGVHSSSPLARLPFTTIDSSTPTNAYRFARLYLLDPFTRKWATVKLDGRDVYRYGRALRFYGVEPEQVARSTAQTRPAIIRLLANIETEAALHYRRTYGARTNFTAHAGDFAATVTHAEQARQTFFVDGSPDHLTQYVRHAYTKIQEPV